MLSEGETTTTCNVIHNALYRNLTLPSNSKAWLGESGASDAILTLWSHMNMLMPPPQECSATLFLVSLVAIPHEPCPITILFHVWSQSPEPQRALSVFQPHPFKQLPLPSPCYNHHSISMVQPSIQHLLHTFLTPSNLLFSVI